MNSIVIFFPVGAVLISLLAYLYPPMLSEYAGAIIPLLGLVMLGMGISLTVTDFKRVLTHPRLILIGTTLQFVLMPFIAWLTGTTLNLPLAIISGLVLVGACPGGTASNVICYLARGNVALSISLTTVSTLAAVFMTPLLTWLYIGQKVDVPVLKMVVNIFKIIIVPVGVGVLINYYFGTRLKLLKHVFPMISMIAIIIIIGIIVAMNHTHLPDLGLAVIFAVVIHNSLGLFLGYQLTRVLGYETEICKTIAIEVGMQNSGLGVALAHQYFSTIAALPGAFFSIWHNISGSVLAGIWSTKAQQKIGKV